MNEEELQQKVKKLEEEKDEKERRLEDLEKRVRELEQKVNRTDAVSDKHIPEGNSQTRPARPFGYE